MLRTYQLVIILQNGLGLGLGLVDRDYCIEYAINFVVGGVVCYVDL